MMAGNRDLQFRTQLYRLGEQLTRQDLDSLTFLCRDIIPVARMERVRSPTDLWQALSERGKLSKHDLSYLTSLLNSIDKVNLLEGLQEHGFPTGSLQRDAEYKFKEDLLKVALSLTATEVKELSYLFQAWVQINPDKMFSATQMFQVLLQRQIISPSNIEPLFEGLENIGRSDITKYIACYLPRPQVHTNAYQYSGHVMNIDTPSSGLTYHGSLETNPGSYRPTPSTSDDSTMESSDGGLTSIQVTDEGHQEKGTIVSPHQHTHPAPSGAPFPSGNYDSNVMATPNEVTPFGLMFNPFEGDSMKQNGGHLYLLSMKEGQLRQMEQEMGELQRRLTDQTSLSERILQERSGENETYVSSIQNLQGLLAAKNQEVASLTEELHHYHADMALVQATSSFRTEDYYAMDKSPHGYCLIFNNYDFYHPHDKSKAHPFRGGANIDQGHLIQTFKYLRYEVVVKENHTAEQMQDCIFEFASKDHSHFDSFVCCVLTHGEDNVVHGADSQELNFQAFAATIKLSPTLRGKPKIYFVQACRGEQEKKGFDIQKDSGGDVQSSNGRGSTTSVTATIPQDADFFFGFATPPGNAAYRSKRHGSWYVSQLCEVLVNHAYTDTLSSMMKKVNKKVSEAYTKEGFKQCTEYVDRLPKKVHFFHFIKNT